MINCNECKYVSITEQQQTDKKIDHKCLKYNVKLFHKSNNPKIEHNYIYPYIMCGGNSFEQK